MSITVDDAVLNTLSSCLPQFIVGIVSRLIPLHTKLAFEGGILFKSFVFSRAPIKIFLDAWKSRKSFWSKNCNTRRESCFTDGHFGNNPDFKTWRILQKWQI